MDQELRASERDGSTNLLLRYRAGMISVRTMKRLAVCGNQDAARILGFRRKAKPHLLAVLKVMLADCPDRVAQVANRVVAVKEFTHPKLAPKYKWMKRRSCPESRRALPLLFSRMEPHFVMARSLVGYGMPGFWWLGKELCKLGKVL
jgi:hypothetical protein